MSHLLLQSKEKRKEFKPAVLRTDTCPHNEAFWKSMFGDHLATKLGLFHLIHRIMDTIDSRCELYWKCVVKLRNAIYSEKLIDEEGLLKALKDGSFSQTGKRLSDSEIRDLRHSKRWKQRYSEFLRKEILPGSTQRHRLQNWIDEFRDECDQSGKAIFARNTEKVATEQLKKVHHSSDVPGMDMCQEIPPGPRSTHGLSKWKSDRPESALEKFHELLAHYGNLGTNKKLADILTLGGTTEFNCKMRWKFGINKKLLAGESVDIPGSFVDLPRFYDHSYLHYLNDYARKCGLPPMFEDVHPVGKNNGEVFLSKYLEEQMARNKVTGKGKKDSICRCPTCTTYLSETEDNANDNDDCNAANDDDKNDNNDANLPVLVPAAAPPFTMQPLPRMPLPRMPPFLPPIPLAMYGGWMQHQRPQDCCYMVGNYHYCQRYEAYLRQKKSGVRVLGKPPHDSNCPVRHKLK
jgi:hypothetical protein